MAKKAAVKKSSSSKDSGADNAQICAVLSYFLVGIIWYFADEKLKKNKYVGFHARQALVLIIVDAIIWIANLIIPFLGIVWTIAWIGLFVLWIIALINVIQKKEEEVPIIGGLAKNFKF